MVSRELGYDENSNYSTEPNDIYLAGIIFLVASTIIYFKDGHEKHHKP